MPSLIASVFLAVMGASSTASAADVISDGAEFDVDLTSASGCFVMPIELRRPEACEGFTPEAVSPPADQSGVHILSMALLHLPNGELGQIIVMRQRRAGALLDRASGERELVGYASGVRNGLPNKNKTKTSAFRMDSSIALVRGEVDIQDVGDDRIATQLAHHSVSLAFGVDAVYYVVVMGPSQSRKALNDTADRLAPTIHLAHSAPVFNTDSLGYQLGRWSVRLLLLVAGIVAAVLAHRASKRNVAARAQAAAARQYAAASPANPISPALQSEARGHSANALDAIDHGTGNRGNRGNE